MFARLTKRSYSPRLVPAPFICNARHSWLRLCRNGRQLSVYVIVAAGAVGGIGRVSGVGRFHGGTQHGDLVQERAGLFDVGTERLRSPPRR